MKKNNQRSSQTGQILVSLLIFVIFALIVTSAAVAVIISSSQSITAVKQGEIAYTIAESGVENAILRVLRDRSYTGEVLPVDGGSATITVTGTSPIEITSVGTFGTYIRTIYVQTQFNQGVLEIITWEEL